MDNQILNSWSFISFAQEFGKPKMAPFTNGKTGEEFLCPVFLHKTKRNAKGQPLATLVSVANKLGKVDKNYIAQHYQELQIIQLPVDAQKLQERAKAGKQLETYVLCSVGASTWEDIEIPGLD